MDTAYRFTSVKQRITLGGKTTRNGVIQCPFCMRLFKKTLDWLGVYMDKESMEPIPVPAKLEDVPFCPNCGAFFDQAGGNWTRFFDIEDKIIYEFSTFEREPTDDERKGLVKCADGKWRQTTTGN